MIAPIAQRQRIPRHRALAIRQEDEGISGRLSHLIKNHPAPAITVAVVCGAALGWLVKRKEW